MDASLELHSESVFVGTDPNQLNNQSADASTDSIPDFSTLPPGQSRAPVYGAGSAQHMPSSGPASIIYDEDAAGGHLSDSEELDEFEQLERALQQEAPKPAQQQPRQQQASSQHNGTSFERSRGQPTQQQGYSQRSQHGDDNNSVDSAGPPVSKLVARVFGVGSSDSQAQRAPVAQADSSMEYDEHSGEVSFHRQAPQRHPSSSSHGRPRTGSSGSGLSLQPPQAARGGGGDDRSGQSSRRHRSSGQSRSTRASSPGSDRHRSKRDRRHRSRGGDSRRRGRRSRDGVEGGPESGGEGGAVPGRHRGSSLDERPPLHGSNGTSANTSLDTSLASLGDESVDMLVTRVAAVQPELASIVHAQMRRLAAQQAEVDAAEREAETEAAALAARESALASAQAALASRQAAAEALEAQCREQREDFDAWAAAERAALQAHVAEEKSKAKAAVRVAQRQARAMADGAGGSPAKGSAAAGEVDALKATLSKNRAEAAEREEKLRGTVARYQGLNKQLQERLEALEAEVEQCETARVQAWKSADESKARERSALHAQRAAESKVASLQRQLEQREAEQREAEQREAEQREAEQRNSAPHERWPRASDDILPEGGSGARRPPPSAPGAGAASAPAADSSRRGYGYFDRDDTAGQDEHSDDGRGYSGADELYSDEEGGYSGHQGGGHRGPASEGSAPQGAGHAYGDEQYGDEHSEHGSYEEGEEDEEEDEGEDEGGALSDGGDPDPGATSLLAPDVALVSERELGQGKTEQKFSDGSRVVSFRNGTVKEALPDGRSVIRFHNGDVKRSYPGEGLVVYFYAGAGTLHTTYASGVEVFKFPNGQTERHLANGCKEIHFSDGTVKMVLPSGEQRSTFPDGSTLVEHAEGGRTLYAADGTLLEHDAADEV